MDKSLYHRLLIASCLAWFCTSQYVANGNGAINFPDVPTCRGSRMHKLMLNQTGYIQFVHYDVIVPDLTAFHSCFWFNVFNPRRPATFLSYARNFEVETNLLTIQWSGGRRAGWSLEVNNQTIARRVQGHVKANSWHHACFSWDGIMKEYSIYQDGDLLISDTYNRPRNSVIRGGGLMTSGQHQENRLTGMDQGEGLEGWLTLFHVSSYPLGSGPYSQSIVSNLFRDCTARSRGNVVDWLHSPRKGYGGSAEFPANEDCQDF